MLTLVGWLVEEWNLIPLLVVGLLEAALAWRLSERVQRVLGPVERIMHDLALFAGLLARIEREPSATPHLRRVRTALDSAGLPPSRRIAQLSRLIDWLNAQHNQLFMPIALLLLWRTQMAFAIETWRATAGLAVARWLAAVGEFEALCALASYAYENPEDPFPEVVAQGPCFHGEGLGHPLLPIKRCVRNDLCLGAERALLIVSGSNMSGKSTLLRTVGINTVLALAGAPVRARRLRLSPLVVGATLRIQDSLQAGRSRFYAEIQRMRQLLDLTRGSPPLLFLLDELFQGTNSHDRRLGAEAVVRSLLDYRAIGLITTHDLALTQIAERVAPRAANVHFEDTFENGTMTFDYRMRQGVVQKSNALALMRAVGIDV
jgi:DNA mismatch repair ATPase MutS